MIKKLNKLLFYIRIFSKLGPSHAAERESMLNTIVQWTIEFCPEYPHGHPSLHKDIGFVYWTGMCN